MAFLKISQETTAAFIREHRSTEASFETLYKRLEEEMAGGNAAYTTELKDVKEKAAAAYKTAKKTGGTAWPEFEKFVSGFERVVLHFLHEQ